VCPGPAWPGGTNLVKPSMLVAVCHGVNVASITSRHPGPARWLGDLPKMAASVSTHKDC